MPLPLYLRLKDVPELADLPPAERYRIWFKCVRHSPRGLKAWTAFVLPFLPFGIPLLYPARWTFVVVVPLLNIPLVLNFNRIQVEQLRPHFRAIRAKMA